MPAQLEPIKRFKCTYEDCKASFDTDKEMKKHKQRSEQHDYCSRCDQDFANWDEYTQHKIYRPDNHHTACRVCGDEFKSVAGMKKHVEISHPINQQVACVGCGETFKRAAHLVEHIEFGHCKKITAQEFSGHVQHKSIITTILNSEIEKTTFLKKINHFNAAQDNDAGDGGVAVNDLLGSKNDEEQGALPEPLEPTLKPDVLDPQHKVGQYWPPLPSSKVENTSKHDGTESLTETLRGVAISASSYSDTVAEYSTRSVTGSVAGSAPYSQPDWEVDPTAAERMQIIGNVWDGSAKTLFPNAKATPATDEWRAALKLRDEEMDAKEGINVLKSRFWDPSHPDYNAERFYNAIIQRYVCPFPHCQEHLDLPIMLEVHIMAEHRIMKQRCPHCLKFFKSTTALIAHCEAPNGRCKIAHTERFNIFLDKVSGGFLGAKETIRPDHMDLKTVMVENEDGEMVKYQPPSTKYVQYEASKPSNWKPSSSSSGAVQKLW